MHIVGYRQASYRTPVRDTPSHEPGRFHHAGAGPAQYLCLHPLGPSAEIVRHAWLDDEAAVAVLSLRIWALRMELPDDLPELTYRNCGDVAGLTPEQLVGDDHRPTQMAADALRRRGVGGFIFPSAALPGTRNLVLFGERVAIGYQDDPVDEWEVPASMTTSRGAPPVSLHRLVRRFGQPHAELEAVRRGDTFRFAEPGWAVEAAT